MLVTVDRLEPAGIVVPHQKPFGRDDLPDPLEDLLQQFRVSGVRHILLMNGGINDARIECPLIVMVFIDTDTPGQCQLHIAHADAVAEVHQLRRGANNIGIFGGF